MNAYSRLNRLLKAQRLSVQELHRRIISLGISVNIKSLYRLSDENRSIDRLDMRVAGAICQACTVALSEWIAFEDEQGSMRSMALYKQKKLEHMMNQNNNSLLTDVEFAEFQILVREAEEISLYNARLLAQKRVKFGPDMKSVDVES